MKISCLYITLACLILGLTNIAIINKAAAQKSMSQGTTLDDQASRKIRAANFSNLVKTGSATVTAIIDPISIQTNQGDIIRLSAIESPDYRLQKQGPFSIATMEILSDMLLGQTITLYQTKDPKTGRINRMRHKLAHITRTADGLWVQGALLSLGLVRTQTTRYTPEMATQMHALENLARAQALGLWGQAQYLPLRAAEASQAIGKSHIIQGKVHSASTHNGRIFINFGPNWRTDFTLLIPSEHKKAFYKAKINPLNWQGYRIEARGWVDEYNGPVIEIDHPQAVRILSKPKAAKKQKSE